ncbi:MAG: hypothetical protein ABI045_02630 [Flavobacteriales bacterium]
MIKAFKNQKAPELIIVVDKLLTGFDTSVNQALYLARGPKDHSLLQTITRANRVYPGKNHDYIIDYYEDSRNFDGDLKMYANDDNANRAGILKLDE